MQTFTTSAISSISQEILLHIHGFTVEPSADQLLLPIRLGHAQHVSFAGHSPLLRWGNKSGGDTAVAGDGSRVPHEEIHTIHVLVIRVYIDHKAINTRKTWKNNEKHVVF